MLSSSSFLRSTSSRYLSRYFCHARSLMICCVVSNGSICALPAGKRKEKRRLMQFARSLLTLSSALLASCVALEYSAVSLSNSVLAFLYAIAACGFVCANLVYASCALRCSAFACRSRSCSAFSCISNSLSAATWARRIFSLAAALARFKFSECCCFSYSKSASAISLRRSTSNALLFAGTKFRNVLPAWSYARAISSAFCCICLYCSFARLNSLQSLFRSKDMVMNVVNEFAASNKNCWA
jgi:hypothetical protein